MRHLLSLFFSLLSLSSCSKEPAVLETSPPTASSVYFLAKVGPHTFKGLFYNTQAAEVFREMLPLTLVMGDLNDNEKYGDLPQKMPTSPIVPATLEKGDLMLFGSQTLVLFYKTFSSPYSYTRIAKLENPAELLEVLGTGNVTIKFELE